MTIDNDERLAFNAGVTRARNAYRAKFCEIWCGQLRTRHPTLCPTCARQIAMARASSKYRRRKANP